MNGRGYSNNTNSFIDWIYWENNKRNLIQRKSLPRASNVCVHIHTFIHMYEFGAPKSAFTFCSNKFLYS